MLMSTTIISSYHAYPMLQTAVQHAATDKQIKKPAVVYSGSAKKLILLNIFIFWAFSVSG